VKRRIQVEVTGPQAGPSGNHKKRRMSVNTFRNNIGRTMSQPALLSTYCTVCILHTAMH
jgi:hypothetical protein